MGFLAGSLALIILDVLVQPQAAGKVDAGTNILLKLVTRMLSGDIAAIPLKASATPSGPSTRVDPPAPPGLGGPGVKIPPGSIAGPLPTPAPGLGTGPIRNA